MKNLILLITLTVVAISCTPKPEAISYGSDICQYCKMTIVDQQHASELVTSKGKVYKFDAMECMLNYKKESETTEFAIQLTNVFESPKELVNAEKSHYLISKAIPSPMGAFLTAFKDESAAREFQTAKGGEIFTWESLQNHHEALGEMKLK